MPFTQNKLSRREFLLAWLALGMPVAAGGPLVWYANNVEPSWLEIVRVRIPLRHLPRALSGLTIAQISDLHLGPFVTAQRVREVVDAALKLQADVAVVTGDFATSLESGEANLIVQELSRLTAPLGAYTNWPTRARESGG